VLVESASLRIEECSCRLDCERFKAERTWWERALSFRLYHVQHLAPQSMWILFHYQCNRNWVSSVSVWYSWDCASLMYSFKYNQQDATLHNILYCWHTPHAVCTVLSSWWWAEKPPETCRTLTAIKNIVYRCILLVSLKRILSKRVMSWALSGRKGFNS
jgi:hypothetical protein